MNHSVLWLPQEEIVGSEVGSAEGLVRDIGSGVFTTFFSLPSFVCASIYLSSLCSTTLKFKMFLLLLNIASTEIFFSQIDVYLLCERYAFYAIIFQHLAVEIFLSSNYFGLLFSWFF